MYLHGWPISLVSLCLAIVMPRKRRCTWVLLASCAMLAFFYAMKRSILGWYYFELMPVLMILGAYGIVQLARFLRSRGPRWSKWSMPVWRAVIAGAVTSCSVTIPLAMAREHVYVQEFNHVHDRVVRSLAGQKAAVLLTSEWDPIWRQELLSRNTPFLDGQIVYAYAPGGEIPLESLHRIVGPRSVYTLRSGDFRDMKLVPYVPLGRIEAASTSGTALLRQVGDSQ